MSHDKAALFEATNFVVSVTAATENESLHFRLYSCMRYLAQHCSEPCKYSTLSSLKGSSCLTGYPFVLWCDVDLRDLCRLWQTLLISYPEALCHSLPRCLILWWLEKSNSLPQSFLPGGMVT